MWPTARFWVPGRAARPAKGSRCRRLQEEMAGTDRSEETVVSESQVVLAITTEGAGSQEGMETAGPPECEDCLRPLDAQRP